MSELTASQTRDALAYMEAISKTLESIPDEPKWGDGLHLVLPAAIPLKSDFIGDTHTYAWLVANDFNGYDLTTTDPTKKD